MHVFTRYLTSALAAAGTLTTLASAAAISPSAPPPSSPSSLPQLPSNDETTTLQPNTMPHHHAHHHHPPRQSPTSPRLVIAHYMHGLTSTQTPSEWAHEIALAQQSGIDGFALNMGRDDPWNEEQLDLAFSAAESLPSPPSTANFKLFISFDMADPGKPWSVEQVVRYINRVKDRSSYLKIEGRAMVSTFEGPSWAENWSSVRQQVSGGIYFVPDWSSLGPDGVQGKLGGIDGAFNWGAWPNANSKVMTTDLDEAYKRVLGGKTYMMGVSPYFYTRLPQWSKNWYSTSTTLWFDRWAQILTLPQIQPDIIQLLTWNDFGESSYLTNPADIPRQIVSGAEEYVSGMDHGGFRAVLPYFVRAWKAGGGVADGGAGGQLVDGEEGTGVMWYRTTRKDVCGDGGTVWGQGGSVSARDGADDVVSIILLRSSGGSVGVSIGGGGQVMVEPTRSVGNAHLYVVSMDGRTGAVSASVDGKSVVGPEVKGECPASGIVNFNSVAVKI